MATEIKFFMKQDCEKCDYAKARLADLADRIAFYDVGTRDGLAESMLYGVSALPAIILTEDEAETLAWRGGENHQQPLLVFLKELQARLPAPAAV